MIAVPKVLKNALVLVTQDPNFIDDGFQGTREEKLGLTGFRQKFRIDISPNLTIGPDSFQESVKKFDVGKATVEHLKTQFCTFKSGLVFKNFPLRSLYSSLFSADPDRSPDSR